MVGTLSGRLADLLEHCIEDYIRSAVPIASGSLAVQLDGTRSSASIRNDLKILDEMGFMRQVHVSGGRVPTTEGYRFYVNRVMGSLNIRPGELSLAAECISARVSELPTVIDDICKRLESTTDYPIVVRRQFDKLVVEDIRIVNLLSGAILVLIKTNAGSLSQSLESGGMTGGGLAGNDSAGGGLTEKQCLDAAAALTTRSRGLSLRAMLENLPKIAKELRADLSFFEALCTDLSVKLEETIESNLSHKINVTKLLEMPDFEQVRKLGRALNDDTALENILSQNDNIVIDEDMSIIKFDYKVGGESIASVGILGPDRMDYKSLITALYSLMSTVKDARKIEGGKNERKKITAARK